MKSEAFCGDCLDFMRALPDETVDLTVTSPPYDNIRDYVDKVLKENGLKFDWRYHE